MEIYKNLVKEVLKGELDNWKSKKKKVGLYIYT